jgi:hypothetical protein
MTTTLERPTETVETQTIPTPAFKLTPEELAQVNAAVKADIDQFNARPKPRRGYIPLDACSALGLLRKGELTPAIVYQRVLADEFQLNVPVNQLTAFATAMAVGNDASQVLLAMAFLGNSRDTMDCAVLVSLSGSIKERPAIVAFGRILRQTSYAAAFAEASLNFVHPNERIRETALTVIAQRYLPRQLQFAVRPVKWVLGKFFLPKAEPIRAELTAAA